MGMSCIRVTIDRLVLKGFEAGDRRPLIEGLQAELSRLLADPTGRADWARPHRTPVMRLGRIPVEAAPSGTRKFGAGLARAIGRGLKP
jgi:hypothetical protein